MSIDVILTNGVVHTVDDADSRCEAIAIVGGRIAMLGTSADVAALAGPATTVVDLDGRMVLPGFIDAHMHASCAVDELLDLRLDGGRDLDGYLAMVRRFAAEHPELPAIRGSGWSDAFMPSSGGPAATDLDAVCPDRPVVLYDDSYHAAWVNSAALRRAGIGPETPEPANGMIERLPDGAPSGTLREGPTALLDDVLPARTPEQVRAGILHFQRAVAGRYGLTTVQDAGLRPGQDAALRVYEELQDEGLLTARYCLSLVLKEDRPLPAQVEAAVEERARHSGPLVTAAWAKLFVDGVIEGHTALLKEPYADEPGFRGRPIWAGGRLDAASVAAAAAGFRLHYHAIGDAAVAAALDAIAAAGRATGGRVERPLITHLQVVDLDDLPRFAELGVIAVVQPYWFQKDDLYRERQVPYLGRARADREYPMRSLWRRGIVAASASDYPVSPPPDPLRAIHRGVARRDPAEPPADGPLWPEESVTVEQMIRSWTRCGALALGCEDEVGSLEVGKVADAVVLSDDITAVPADEITAARVELTLFGGRPVFATGAFEGLKG